MSGDIAKRRKDLGLELWNSAMSEKDPNIRRISVERKQPLLPLMRFFK